jgi:hypothetical protein
LNLRQQEHSLLRAYAVGLCLGNHSPYDAIPPLSQVLSPLEWHALLEDFQALNPFQPELVRAIVDQVAPLAEPANQPGSWREPPARPAGLQPPSEPRSAPQPMAASGQGAAPADANADTERERNAAGPNRRDLGALAGMFDGE